MRRIQQNKGCEENCLSHNIFPQSTYVPTAVEVAKQQAAEAGICVWRKGVYALVLVLLRSGTSKQAYWVENGEISSETHAATQRLS